jgi:hypothetical protein
LVTIGFNNVLEVPIIAYTIKIDAKKEALKVLMH